MIIMMIIITIITIILNMCPWSQKDGLFTSNTCMPALKGNDEKVHDNVCSQKPFPNNHHHRRNNNTMSITDGGSTAISELDWAVIIIAIIVTITLWFQFIIVATH